MSLTQPYLTHGTNYSQHLLLRLQREVFNHGQKAYPFPRLCDMVSIPHDLRAALLKSLVLHGYVQPQTGDLIVLTPAGAQQATALAN
jgi:hypothetical protein